MIFEYYNPIRFRFGGDVIADLGRICGGRKALIVYGGGSARRNGAFDEVIESLDEASCDYVEYGGQTLAAFGPVQEGIELCRREGCECVIGLGGSTAMVIAKVIAFGAVHDDLAAFIDGDRQADDSHLLTILVPTFASSGTEATGEADLLDHHGNEVELYGIFPDYCLADPKYMKSLHKIDLAYSVLVAFIQTSCFYLDNVNTIARECSKTIMKVLLDSYKKLLDDSGESEPMGNIMWASCISAMGILGKPLPDAYTWSLYEMAYIPRKAHDVPYREALTLVYTQWLREISRYHQKDVATMMKDVFGLDDSLDDGSLVEEGCCRIEKLLEKSGTVPRLWSYGVCPGQDEIEGWLDEEDYGDFGHEEFCSVLQKCYGEAR
ncbi:MAG: iron-containing alcohol dehydrogenase [Anaerovoracaceae bacterium]|jgi:alcohol dehydrogenase YqhD (iron-dependent ADH family)